MLFRSLFGATQWHGLRPAADGEFRIEWKKVELANCDATLDGISVPF